MEGQHALKTGELVSLSESQIVDCDVNGGDEGCNGGWMDGAFSYVINNSGIERESDYPYDPHDPVHLIKVLRLHSVIFQMFMEEKKD